MTNVNSGADRPSRSDRGSPLKADQQSPNWPRTQAVRPARSMTKLPPNTMATGVNGVPQPCADRGHGPLPDMASKGGPSLADRLPKNQGRQFTGGKRR